MTPTPSYRQIILTQDQIAKVSAEDFEYLSVWKWCAVWSRCTRSYYAVRNFRVAGTSVRYLIYMHREILGLKRGDTRQADHANHDTLDNSRENLRIATRIQQCSNRRINGGYAKGIRYRKDRGKWQARITYKGRLFHLGTFETAEEAYAAYREAAIRLRGEFAHLL